MKIPRTMQLKTGAVALEAGGGPDPEPRRFSMLAYTGAPVDWPFCPVVFDLAGGQIGEVPILQQHDHTRIVGMATSAVVAADGLRLSGVLYDTPAAREVANLADQGFKWQASVGLSMKSDPVFLDDGDTRELNGRTVSGPCVVVEQWLLKESSFVPLGADSATSSVVLADTAGGEVDVRTKEVRVADIKQVATVAELDAEFGDDPRFVLEQLKAGASLLEAQAEYGRRMKAKVAELSAEIEKAKQAQAAKPGPVADRARARPGARGGTRRDRALGGGAGRRDRPAPREQVGGHARAGDA